MSNNNLKFFHVLIVLIFALCFTTNINAQFNINYNPEVQHTGNLQYFAPKGDSLFVGDCIPFYLNGTYYLYWLIDKGHHAALNGLGGHQWTLSTTKDLKTWKHYPVVIGIDEEWEKSICTGSVVYHNNKFYAFYSTRLVDSNGDTNEQLSYAISTDGIKFQKQKPNPFYTFAPGYSKRDFRDPKVVVDKDGIFHLFIASQENIAPIKKEAGCLVHLTSSDLENWKVEQPLISGQTWVPECPDYFKWNNWYYLVYGKRYLISKNPFGPWSYPKEQIFAEPFSAVPKTAEFNGGRRIAASWIVGRYDNKDNGKWLFGGNILLREIVQHKDGSLGTKFPAEAIPQTGKAISYVLNTDNKVEVIDKNEFTIRALGSLGLAHIEKIPVNCRITFEIDPLDNNEEVGLYLRSTAVASEGYKLSIKAAFNKIILSNTNLNGVDGLDKPCQIDIIMKENFIDVCVNNRWTIVNRLIEKKGDFIWFFAKHGQVKFKNLKIYPIL
jgi:hypothetical protein